MCLRNKTYEKKRMRTVTKIHNVGIINISWKKQTTLCFRNHKKRPLKNKDNNSAMTLTSQISTHHMPEGGELFLQFKDILCMVHEPNLFCQLTQTSATSTKNLSTVTHYNRFTWDLQAGKENSIQTRLVSNKRSWTWMHHLQIPSIINIHVIFEESLCLWPT